MKVNGSLAFDIASDGNGGNTGWLLAGGALYTVDMMTGAAKAFGRVSGLDGRIGDIAILSAM